MGSIVTLTIATDHLHEIEENPESLIQAIRDGMSSRPGDRSQTSGTGITVHSTHHYSEPGLYFVADARSIEFGVYALGELIKNQPEFWGSERGLELLAKYAQTIEDALVRCEQLINSKKTELAREARNA